MVATCKIERVPPPYIPKGRASLRLRVVERTSRSCAPTGACTPSYSESLRHFPYSVLYSTFILISSRPDETVPQTKEISLKPKTTVIIKERKKRKRKQKTKERRRFRDRLLTSDEMKREMKGNDGQLGQRGMLCRPRSALRLVAGRSGVTESRGSIAFIY